MSGAGVLCQCDCLGCYTNECENCPTGAPTGITVTFSGITIEECVVSEAEFAYGADGDLDAVNGTFCLGGDVLNGDPCGWIDGTSPAIPESTLGIYYVPEFDTCEQIIATGVPGPVGFRIRRLDGKWQIAITATGDGEENNAIIFYAEISTEDCRTGGTASNTASGTTMTLDFGDGEAPYTVIGGGGSVTLTPCC